MDQRNGTWRPGAIVWRELASRDLDAATQFYAELLGWTHHDSPGGHGIYRHFRAGDTDVAGGWKIGPEMAGVPSHWIVYVSVDDVDAAAARAKDRGGKLHMGPMDVPHVGRMAHVADPQGAGFALFRDAKGDGPAAHPPYPQGVFCWESLVTTDIPAAAAFYAEITGQAPGEFQGMTVLSAGDPPEGVADLGPAPPGAPPHWMSHVVVGSLAETRARVAPLGGTILVEEIVVPTVGKMTIIQDPTGAVVSLFEPEPRA